MFSNVILYWSVLLLGVLTGLYMKKRKSGASAKLLRFISPVQTAALAALIFVLGAGIGSDEQVVSSLSELGLSAVVIGISGLAGSVFLTWAARKLSGIDKEGYVIEKCIGSSETRSAVEIGSSGAKAGTDSQQSNGERLEKGEVNCD